LGATSRAETTQTAAYHIFAATAPYTREVEAVLDARSNETYRLPAAPVDWRARFEALKREAGIVF